VVTKEDFWTSKHSSQLLFASHCVDILAGSRAKTGHTRMPRKVIRDRPDFSSFRLDRRNFQQQFFPPVDLRLCIRLVYIILFFSRLSSIGELVPRGCSHELLKGDSTAMRFSPNSSIHPSNGFIVHGYARGRCDG